MFFLSVAMSWKLKARLAAKGASGFQHQGFCCHPDLLSILRTLRNTSWQVSKLHWSSAALRSSILRGSYKSGEDM